MIPLGVMASGHVPPGPASGGAYRDEVLADSPYLYYPLDDASTPTDVTGTTAPDLIAGVTLGAPGIGDGATAATFDGGAAGRGIRIPSASLPASLTVFTVEMLVKATNLSTTRMLAGREGMALMRHSTSALQVYYGTSNRAFSAQPPLDTDVHHVALVVAPFAGLAESRFVYVDGVQAATDTADVSISSSSPLHIGSRQSSNATFLGTIAGFAFYTTALAPERILAHAQAAGVA